MVHIAQVAHEGMQIETEQYKLSAGDKLVGKSLKEVALSKRAGIQLCAIL